MRDIVMDKEGYRLAPLSTVDLPQLAQLHADPVVNRYLSCETGAWTLDRVSAFLDETMDSQERHGFSAFKVLDKDNGFLGWAGFSALEETSEIALRSCFSSEALTSCRDLPVKVGEKLVDWFFENTYFTHVVLPIRTDDHRGRSVAHSLGFIYRESGQIGGMPCDMFQLLSPSMRSYIMSA